MAGRPRSVFQCVCAAGIVVVGLAALTQCKAKPPSTDESAAGARPAGSAGWRYRYNSIEYQVPTAYLDPLGLGQLPASVLVTYPRFQPAAVPTNACVSWFSAEFQHKCSEFDFIITGPMHPNPEQTARNTSINPKDAVYLTDEYGYRVSWRKTASNVRFFTKIQGRSFTYFFCSMEKNFSNQLDGICHDTFPLSDGDSVSFNFPYHLRNELPRIESGINDLVARFRVR